MSNLFLCFYGNSTLWDNHVLVPAYPKGHSYPRPFRYPDGRIQPDLLKTMADETGRRNLVGSTAFLCLRALPKSEEHRWSLVPVREVEITHIDYLPESNSIYFRMGRFFDYTKVSGFRESQIEIPESEREAIGDSIFFRSRLRLDSESFVDGAEEGAWAKYAHLVAKDQDFPINDNARHAVFFRFRTLGGEGASASRIHASPQEGPRYGSVLAEGTSYELVFYHRSPCLTGLDDSVEAIPVKYLASTQNIELNRVEGELTGNYQTSTLSVTALQPSGSWEEITIVPEGKTTLSQKGKKKLHLVKLPIPLKVKRSILHRFRTFWVYVLVLWLALSLLGAAGFLGELAGEVLDVRLIFVTVVASGIASAAIFILQQRLRSK